LEKWKAEEEEERHKGLLTQKNELSPFQPQLVPWRRLGGQSVAPSKKFEIKSVLQREFDPGSELCPLKLNTHPFVHP
jgi:hypothetical protein